MRAVKLGLALAVIAALPASAVEESTQACKVADRALAQGQLEDALSRYQACLKQSAPRFETLSNLGIVYARLGQFNEAIKIYQQALALNPENPQVNMNLGLAFLKSERYEEAGRAFARALLAQPDNTQVEQLLAFCNFQLGQYELAAVEAERVLKAKPEDPSAAFLLGSAYLKLQFYDKAIPLIDLALRKTNSAKTHAILGEAFLGVRAYRKALEEFSIAFKLDPNIPGLHSDMGRAYAGVGTTDQAIKEFRKELEKNANDFEANYNLARLRRLSNDNEAARNYLAKAEQLRPDDPSVTFENAVFAVQAKDYSKAEALLQRVLEKHPNSTEAHVLLSEIYFKTSRRDEAEREKAIVQRLEKEEQARHAAWETASQAYGGTVSPGPTRP